MTRQDLTAEAGAAWEKRGRTLAELWRVLTPTQFYGLCWRRADAAAGPDRVAVLARANDARAARGLWPAVPGWLFPGVPSSLPPRPPKPPKIKTQPKPEGKRGRRAR